MYFIFISIPQLKMKILIKKKHRFSLFLIFILFYNTFYLLKYILIVHKKQNLHERILLKGRMMKVEELKRWNTLQKCKLHRTPGMDLHRKWFLERCFWQQNFSQRGTCSFEQTRVLKSIRAIRLYIHFSFCFKCSWNMIKVKTAISSFFNFYFPLLLSSSSLLFYIYIFQSKYTSSINYNRLLFFSGTI